MSGWKETRSFEIRIRNSDSFPQYNQGLAECPG